MSLSRVRRSDLYARSRSASPSPSGPDPELEAQFRARLASIYGPLSNTLPAEVSAPHIEPKVLNGDDEEAGEDHEQEFEFRLFSSAAPGTTGEEGDRSVQKVILVDDEENIGGGGFVVRERNRGYYFAEEAGVERKLGFETMALSGEEVLSRARKRAWGLEVPWRVRVLKVVGKKAKGGTEADGVVAVEDETQESKKKKPGKKRRIFLRERKKLREKLQEQKKAEKARMEETEREKRTRRNREKKVKRKMKEKAKKVGGAVDNGEDGVLDLGDP